MLFKGKKTHQLDLTTEELRYMLLLLQYDQARNYNYNTQYDRSINLHIRDMIIKIIPFLDEGK